MKPKWNIKPPASLFDNDHERTVEFYFPGVLDAAGMHAGGLACLTRLDAAHASITLYRLDPQVRVHVPDRVQLVQAGLEGRVVQHSDIAALLVATVQLMQLRPALMDDAPPYELMQRYVRQLPPPQRERVATALAELVVHHYATGGDVDPQAGLGTAQGFTRWRMLAAELAE